MDFQRINEKYGRTFLIAVSVLIWGYVIYSLFVNGYLTTWYIWHIPAKEPAFIDFRLLPSGAETFRAGIDPSVSNPNDPKGHIFNYPKIWYIFFYTGITQEDTIWLSILLIVIFFLIVFSFPAKLSVIDSVLTLLIVFSPAAMLLYERGNLDLVFFILCGFAILLLARRPIWAALLLLVGAFFKFFPFFGVGLFLQSDKNRFYKYLFSNALILLLYIGLSVDSLTAAWELTQRGTVISYGVYIFFDLLNAYFRYYLLQIMPESYQVIVLKLLPHLAAFVFVALIFFLCLQKKEALTSDSDRNLTAFRMGALIYVGTFLLGNNWDYRLAFLIFTIPQFSRWMVSVPWRQRWIIIVIFISLVLSCWFMYFNPIIMKLSDYALEFHMKIFDEAMNWILFGGLAYLYIASAPEWFRTFNWLPQLSNKNS